MDHFLELLKALKVVPNEVQVERVQPKYNKLNSFDDPVLYIYR